jgi:hypothetical protein
MYVSTKEKFTDIAYTPLIFYIFSVSKFTIY